MIVAEMSAYAATDSHASGPSQPFTVRWRLGPVGASCASPRRDDAKAHRNPVTSRQVGRTIGDDESRGKAQYAAVGRG